jgi:Fe-S-cluster-containing hydrogenase component 2
MIANYGYKDGSGEFFISIDTDKCDGCGKCMEICTWGVMVVGDDENDPLREELVARVSEEHRKKIKYSCAQCKPVSGDATPPCILSCKPEAINHSW